MLKFFFLIETFIELPVDPHVVVRSNSERARACTCMCVRFSTLGSVLERGGGGVCASRWVTASAPNPLLFALLRGAEAGPWRRVSSASWCDGGPRRACGKGVSVPGGRFPSTARLSAERGRAGEFSWCPGGSCCDPASAPCDPVLGASPPSRSPAGPAAQQGRVRRVRRAGRALPCACCPRVPRDSLRSLLASSR